MARRSSYHVTKRSDGNWQVKKSGASRATSVHTTKKAAVDVGRKTAKHQDQSQLVIHKGDGRIQTEHTYGDDPHPPKG